MSLFAALALLLSPGGEWKSVWDDLERLQSLVPASAPALRLEAELRALGAAREREARKRKDANDTFRARVLLAQLERWRGGQHRPVSPPSTAPAYEAREARLAAEVLADGPARAQAVLLALADDADPRGSGQRELGLRVARKELAACRLDGARALAQELARDESDFGAFELWLRGECLAGELEGAEVRLSERLRRSSGPAPELLLLGAELSLARGEPAVARRTLGRALVLGSDRALLDLAARDLEEGSTARGARLAAEWLDAADSLPPDLERRAWRCYALALVPPPKANSGVGAP